MKNILLVLLFALPLCSLAQNKPEEKKYDMKTYYMVFLKKGPDRTQDSVTAAKIQEGHMAHLNKMANDGKMHLAGPFMEDGDIRGICVYDVATKEEAEQLANEDPAIKFGRLVAEVHKWYAAKGSCLK